MSEKQVAGVEGGGLEVLGVGGEQEPVFDFAVEELDGADGGEFAAQG